MCGGRDEVDTVDRAGWQAQFAAGAAVGDDGVDALAGADDGVDRAGLDTFHAADAFNFTDEGEPQWCLFAAVRIEWQHRTIEQGGERLNTRRPAWRAAIDVGLAAGNGFGVWRARRITATRALRLRQQGVDSCDQVSRGHLAIIRASAVMVRAWRADTRRLNLSTPAHIRYGMMFAISPLSIASVPHAMPAETADHALVREAAEGDRYAFERLYRRHSARVFAVILRLQGGDRARAEDLTQDAFVRVWQKLPEFRFESAFSTWLHRLAVNTALMALRSARGEPAADEDIDDPEFHLAEPLPRSPDLGIDLDKVIARLPPRARAVLVLHDVEGWKHEEISGQLGMAVGSSKAQLHRARNLIKQWLGGSHGRA